jgi:uncharacterized delta-60 repeat protein
VAIQPDGKIVVAVKGYSGGSTTIEGALMRFTQDGVLDAGFGQGGVVYDSYTHRDFHALILQADGKLVAAGGNEAHFDPSEADLSACRFDANGTEDWCARVDFAGGFDNAWALTRQGDGEFVVVGGSAPLPQPEPWSSDFAAIRLTDGGALDAGFGTAGRVTTDLGADDTAYAATALPGGKLLVAGGSGVVDGPKDFAVVRYAADGSLDPTFGQGGVARVAVGSEQGAQAMVLQADGKILLGGGAGGDFALARLMADGRVDPTFGDGGVRRTPFAVGGAGVRAMLLQPDREVVVAGSTGGGDFQRTAGQGQVALARYQADPPVIGTDAFGRTATNGWGAADQGGKWSPFGYFPADYALTGGTGTIRLATAGSHRGQTLSAVSARDTDTTFTARFDKLPAGGIAWVGLATRQQGAQTYYLARPRFDPNGRAYLVGIRYTAGRAAVRLAPAVGALRAAGAEQAEVRAPRLAAVANGLVHVRVQVTGVAPTTIRMKAWQDGQAEPADWQYVATDGAGDIQAAGAVGLHAYLDWAATNAPLTASFDDLAVAEVPSDPRGATALIHGYTRPGGVPACRPSVGSGPTAGQARIHLERDGRSLTYSVEFSGPPNTLFRATFLECTGPNSDASGTVRIDGVWTRLTDSDAVTIVVANKDLIYAPGRMPLPRP